MSVLTVRAILNKDPLGLGQKDGIGSPSAVFFEPKSWPTHRLQSIDKHTVNADVCEKR